MITVLRFLGNLLLAMVLSVLIAALVAVAGGVVLSQGWENRGLDYGAEQGEWAWIDEQPIHYQIWGDEEAPTVVLVHDYHVAGFETWRSNAETLAKWGLRVVAVDLKGFGHSVRDGTPVYSLEQQAEVLAKVLNQLYIQEATVVGHGWGSAVALQLAIDQPQFAGRLMLLAPVIYREPEPIWQRLANTPYVGPAAVWAISAGGPYWLYAQKQALYDPGAVDPEYWRRIQGPTHIEGTIDAQLAMARSPHNGELPTLLSRVQVPVLVISGEAESAAAQQEAQRLCRALPDAKQVTITGAGHHVQLEQAMLVNRYISQFCLLGSR